jgi:cysteine desulfurase/selenocysteine lyase
MSMRTVSEAPRAALRLAYDVRRVREDFPILKQTVHGKPLVYLDNAATSQKPMAVLDVLLRYYARDNANVHRAAHQLSERATREFEGARGKIQRFLNAARSEEIIFTRGTTEAINLVAQTFGRKHVQAGDEVVISWMEHHSNIVPWQLLCEEKGAKLRVVPINDRGEFLFEEYEKLLTPRTKLVSVVHVSNSLGTINPVQRIIDSAHARGIPVLIDGAQAVAHLPVDVQELDCDFYALSGHKLYGPTGIGVLYGKKALLDAMPPWQGGGDMIASVSFAKTTYADLPNKFEAGTPNIAGAIGLGTAVEYVQALGMDNLRTHDEILLRYATEKVEKIPGVRILGTATEKTAVLAFVVTEPLMASLDVGTQLDLEGIAVRTGHHCCQPVMDRYEVPATVRASFGLYNTTADVDAFVDALRRIVARAGIKPQVAQAATEAEAVYPKTYASSPQAAAEKILAGFELLGDGDTQYHYLCDLGKKLLPMPSSLKTDLNRIRGCQSIVFLSARVRPGTQDILEFLADSDADIVRGELAILQRVFSGYKAHEILDFDVEQFLAFLGRSLSEKRRTGLSEMVKRIRGLASMMVAARHSQPQVAPVD